MWRRCESNIRKFNYIDKQCSGTKFPNLRGNVNNSTAVVCLHTLKRSFEENKTSSGNQDRPERHPDGHYKPY